MIELSRSGSSSPASAMTDDRRRSPRVQLLSRLHGTTVSLDVPVKVVQMSLGGMAVETTVAFPVGAVHSFSITLGGGGVAELSGRGVHCGSTAPAGEPPLYLVGLEFVDGDDGGDSGVVEDIMKKVR